MEDWIKLAAVGAAAAHESGLLKGWQRWLRRKKKVLVLGASGAGKTQLIHSLISPVSPRLDWAFERTVNVQKRKVELSDYPFMMIDTPGQRFDEAKRKVAIADAIRTGVEGILNVVSYGYHEGEGDADRAVPKSGPGIARADYLAERRRVEIEQLSEWVTWFGSDTTRWVLTVVTKADLWWPEATKVRMHYELGEYAEAVGGVPSDRSVIPHCSVIEPFFGYKTSGRFGDHHRAKLHAHFCESIVRLTGAVR